MITRFKNRTLEFLGVLVLLVILAISSWSTILMFGIWEQVHNGSEFVYHYSTGIGSLLLGVSAVYAALFGMSKYEKSMIDIESRKVSVAERLEVVRRGRTAFDFAMELLPTLDRILVTLKNTTDLAFLSRREIAMIREEYPESYEVQEARLMGFAVLRRLDTVDELLRGLWDSQAKFGIIFGSEEPFQRISKLVGKIDGHARALVNSGSAWEQKSLLSVLVDADGSTVSEIDHIRKCVLAMIQPGLEGRLMP